jgi:hypothetical protein
MRRCVGSLLGAALIAAGNGCRNFGEPTPPLPPTLLVSPSSLTFSGAADGQSPPTRALTIDQLGSGRLAWTVQTDVPWLSVSSPSDSTPAVVWVSVSAVGMAEGSYAGKITVSSATAANRRVTMPVTLVLDPWLLLTGRWVGVSDSVNLALTVAESNGIVTGWGNFYPPLRPFEVTGTFRSPVASLTLTERDSTVTTFVGSLVGANAVLGTLTGGRLSNLRIAIFRQ